MSDWVLIPCLVALRQEFDAVAPRRDRGADGSIGDSAHTSASDHTPDEDSDILRDRDADSRNEVHGLDIDCTGPWPDGKGGEAGAWFDRTVHAIVDRERAEAASPDVFGRLQYVIWRGRIASRSWGWTWRDYSGPSSHFDHAHFSARYLTRTEDDTRPWGVEEADMALDSDLITITNSTAAEIGKKEGDKVPAATLLQLAVIYSARANAKAGAGNAGVAALKSELDAVRDEVAALKAGGGSVDLDALAERVAQKLADRLAQ
jgi:hypothetical protein